MIFFFNSSSKQETAAVDTAAAAAAPNKQLVSHVKNPYKTKERATSASAHPRDITIILKIIPRIIFAAGAVKYSSKSMRALACGV